MSCIEKTAAPLRPEMRAVAAERLCALSPGRAGLGALAVMAVLLAGCSTGPRAPGAPSTPSGAPAAPISTPATPAAPDTPPDAPKPGDKAKLSLPPPAPVRSHDELRRQAAERLVAANPHMSYMGEVPAVLLAIPVLEVELKHDGHIKRINVLRWPGQATDTVQLAIDALHRAAPFGNVSRMPEPWKFSETFLFNDDRHFKPRTLD